MTDKNPARVIASRTVATTALLVTAALALSTLLVPTKARAAAPADDRLTGAHAPPTIATAEEAAVAQSEVDAALARLAADGALVADTPEIAERAVAPGLASLFGQALFKGIVYGGGRVAMTEALGALGYDPDRELAAALDDLKRSIDQLNAEVEALARGMEDVLAGQDRTRFQQAYIAAGTAATNIGTTSTAVKGWIERGVTPSESNLSDAQTVLRNSIGLVDFHAGNEVSGVLPLMMHAAEAAGVSDLSDYWASIDTTRDDYRAVQAQALGTLDLMLRWDNTGTIASDLAEFTPVATASVERVYSYGIALQGDLVHAKGSRHVLASPGAATPPGTTGRAVGNHADIQPTLSALAANYRSDQHGGRSLEQYLRDNGVPTYARYWDSYDCGYHDNFMRSWYTEGYISGNGYHQRVVYFGSAYSILGGWNQALNRACWQTQGAANHERANPRFVQFTVDLNVAGRAADLDPGRITEAAFPQG